MTPPRDAQVKKVGTDAPSWLVDVSKQEGDKSLDQARQYRQVPRARIIQGASRKPELKQRFGEGSVIMQPGETLIARMDEPFLVVPLFQFTEFSKMADIDDPASSMFQGRSFDQKSEIAKRARDAKLRSEGYGPQDEKGNHQFHYRYVEHLVFASVLYGDHPLRGSTLGISFEKGEYFNGTSFCSAILLRKVEGHTAPLWSQVWELRSRVHKNRKNKEWFGFDFFTPDPAFIQESEAAFMREQHEDLAKDFEKKLIVVDRDDAADDAEVAPSEAEM